MNETRSLRFLSLSRNLKFVSSFELRVSSFSPPALRRFPCIPRKYAMQRASLPLTSAITIAALAFAGCSDLPPDQPGMFATNAAVAGGQMARSGTATTAQSQAGGFSSGAMVTATVIVIQKYQATEQQRRVAQQRGQAAAKRLRVEQERAIAAATKPKAKTKPSDASEPTGGVAMKAKEVDVTRIEPKPKKKLPRYIAVDTTKDERSSPQAAKAIMIFDTQTQEIVGNDVYDVRSTPPVGGTARFETFTAEYVGTGG
jgi:hypothetical protein